ncbi:MAG: hypothetical protein OEZ39_16625 [Gammaproteobacteria bacterium]|nr:hypothetical protein [Gammaproteobacteria bacterium]MDH5653486.1 hypothetical protein [Gammaproteobacteria bacterium]
MKKTNESSNKEGANVVKIDNRRSRKNEAPIVTISAVMGAIGSALAKRQINSEKEECK